LKTELLEGVTGLFRALIQGGEKKILDSLASVVISSFLLSKRLGIGFYSLDDKIEKKIKVNIENDHEIERWYGDLTALLDYIHEQKR